jgi:hypothetical protein
LDYDVIVRTDEQTTVESVDAIIAALYAVPNGVLRAEGNP